jgi:hypothetical protein
MYDLLRNRDTAIKKYEQVVASGPDTPQAEAARRYIKDPYSGG